MDAIFRSTQQALHVAYLVMSEPVREKNGLRLTLIRIIESIGTLNRRQAAFLDYLYGSADGTVNFAGLSPLEVRGQCAMITAAVLHQLPPAERHAIWVRYARGTQRKEGVIWTSKKLRATLNLTNLNAVRYLVAEQSLPKDERDPEKTFKYIAAQTGVPVRTLERAAQQIRLQLRAMENRAYDMLTPLFVRDELVCAASEEEVA
ncbi:gp77 [Burkholderia pseudomallei]|uniref:hypothetical protein n=2 Tax=Burkholderia pseudomallei TaxID=28450 RepID=UPI0005DD9AD0|nr:hypothetical protein [Burkholderia pseudomallei]CAK0038375.1 gp77 [Burkholderia pseudomallei]CAK0040123.1 gp77 [Burkholderia pseudomallei]CAK0063555.1 gp77 [Burkholderia pseudomallei]CFL72144.1 gp77 [Burkholderia pseudomallei]CFT62728.1 gp77 [Burkholderia pseudomallei]